MLWKDVLHSNASNYPSSSQHQSPLLNGFIILAGLGYFSMQSFKLFSCNNESFLEHLILHTQRNVSVLIYECCWTKISIFISCSGCKYQNFMDNDFLRIAQWVLKWLTVPQKTLLKKQEGANSSRTYRLCEQDAVKLKVFLF